jgi:hypothetical protein
LAQDNSRGVRSPAERFEQSGGVDAMIVGSLVDITTGQIIPLESYHVVEFGEGDQKVSISTRDGVVEISTARTLVINPRTSNVIHVRSVK